MSVRQIMPGALRYSLMTNMVDQSSSFHKPFLLSALFLSGFAALIYEIVWQRILVRFLGGTFSSVSLIVCVFLGGMAIGAMLVSIAQSKNKIKHPGNVWASLELVLWICGLASIFLQQFSSQPLPHPVLTNVISVFLLLIPTTAMGAILPIAISLLGKNADSRSVLPGYAINTAGALAGAICTSFFILPSIGISLSLLLAASVNFFLMAILFFKRKRLVVDTDISLKSEQSTPIRFLSAIAFISGLIIMMLEVCWTRYFSLIAGSNTYTFGLVVAFCLAGLTLGAGLVTIVISLKPVEETATLPTLTVVFTIASLCLMASIFGLSYLPNYFPDLLNQSLESFASGDYFQVKMPVLACCMNLLILMPCTICGTIFPLVLSFSKQTARLLAYNTAGCVVGYIFISVWFEIYQSNLTNNTSTEMCFLVILGFLFACTLVLIRQISRARITLVSGTCLTLIVLSAPLVLLKPQWSKEALTHSTPSNPSSLRFFEEGQNAVISVENINGLTVLKSNGVTEGSLPDPVPSDMPPLMSDMPTQVLLGLLPQALDGTKQSSGLVIGMGTGMTCGTAIGLNDVKNCTVVEIEKKVLDAAKEFAAYNHSPWDSPKCKIEIADARHYLNNTDKKFDWIVSQPGEPSNSGSANLYTEEFFRIAKNRLKISGTYVQWIQLYGLNENNLNGLISAFSKTFEDNTSKNRCLAFQPRGGGEIILVSCQNPEMMTAKIQEIFKRSDFTKRLFSIGINTPKDLLADCVGATKPRKLFSNLNTDDNLVVEFTSAKNRPSTGELIARLQSKQNEILKKPLSELDQELKFARAAHSMPLYTCASDYYLISQSEPETLSEVYPKSLDASLFGPADSPASITYRAFTDCRNGADGSNCLTQFEKSLEVNPLQYIANFYAAHCHLKLGNIQDALWRMKMASQIYPISNRPHFFVSAVLIRDKQFDLAKQNIAKLSKRDLKTEKEKQWLKGLEQTISTGQEDPCINEILSP
ncbi:MAG: methyltransferase [Cyanobacteria bacterium TGS_CYA1]|nr:methyltransferase [Cyanobacteria bacterium TGS_CYA1]